MLFFSFYIPKHNALLLRQVIIRSDITLKYDVNHHLKIGGLNSKTNNETKPYSLTFNMDNKKPLPIGNLILVVDII